MIRPTPNAAARAEAVSPIAAVEADLVAPGFFGDMAALTKARLSTLVLVTTLVGFCMGSGEAFDWFLLCRALFGTALATASAAVLNQVLERKVDRLMRRTRNRPLPAGRMKTTTALGLGILLGVASFIYLMHRVNPLSAWLSLATLIVYVLIYTPMKRRTAWCVTVGAVSGGLPPLIGWAAARGTLDAPAWILFGVLFLWQIPHFLAIAWMYRDEYAQAGFVMLRSNDINGLKTARESLLFSLALALLTLVPLVCGLATPLYGVGALLCDALLLTCAVQFLVERNRPTARRLFFASIIYLPLLLGLMVFTKA